MQQLPNDQREALILIGVSGLAYEEAAEICGCAVGTMKSRVNRARNRLANLLSIHATSEFRNAEDWQTADPASAGHQLPKTGSD